MRYLALRRRAEVLLAGLGRDGIQELHILGGMPLDAAVSPQAPQPEAPHPPRMAGFPDPEPSAE
jgi:hypothetical protein